MARADQKAFLRRVLASKAKITARSTSQSAPFGAANHPPQQQQYHVIDQKALLKKVLSKKSQTNTTLHHDENVESAVDNPVVVSMEMKPLNRTRSNSHDDDQDDSSSSSSLYDSQSKKPSPERLFSKVRPRQETRESETEYSSGYIAFLDGLKKEVAGDHTEVRQNQNWWWWCRLEFLCTLTIMYIS
jgi:hypothetical protein